MSNKRFAEEFKIEAVKQITEGRYPVTEVQPGWAFLNTAFMLGLKNIRSQPPCVSRLKARMLRFAD